MNPKIREIANEVIKGLWGNGEERKKKLTESGYDYATIQSIIDGVIKTPVNIFKDLLMSIGFVELNPDIHYNQKPPHSFIIRKLFMPHKVTISKNGYVFTIEGGYTSFEIFQNLLF